MKTIHRVGATIAVAGSTLLGVPAGATSIAPERDYQCAVSGAATADTDVSLTLDVPDAAKPGDVLDLAGTLQLSFPDQVAISSHLQLATTAGITSTTFSLSAVIGEKQYEIKPTEVKSADQKIASPFLVAADVKFAPFTVPNDAQGTLLIRMPTEADALNPVGKNPERVAFDAVITQNSTIVKTRKVGCWVEPGGVLEPLARVPVSSAGSTPPSDGGGGTPAAPESSGSVGIGVLPESGGLVPSLPVDAGSPVGGAPVAAPVITAPVSAAIPPATSHSGTFIASWALFIMVGFLPAVFLAYAVRQRLRLSALQALEVKAD